MDEQADPIELARAVLDANNQGYYTIPAQGLYPHQWLWDSCFVAIGLRHIDVDRAQTEIISLLRGQWHNGMLPHMIFNRDVIGDQNIWKSDLNPYSPDTVATSGITQPPVLAEAIVQIGNKLKKAERRTWYKQVYPTLLAYHQWLYNDRDPHNEGLVLQIHPWETGLDNTPPWMSEMHQHRLPLWIRAVRATHTAPLLTLFRRDTHRVPASERISTLDALGLFSAQRSLRRKNYDISRILKHSMFTIEDATFNAIFIRANQHLRDIAALLKEKLPQDLVDHTSKTELAFEQLWDPHSGQYYSRDFATHALLKTSTIATLMPLYAGTIQPDRAKQLVRLLENRHMFASKYPIPSVPMNSEWFDPDGYWQGPVWVNMNWMIIDGLSRMGFPDHAEALRQSTLDMVLRSGFAEQFNPKTGEAGGAAGFSWTAALALDLVKR